LLDSPVLGYQNDWHFVEVYLNLSIRSRSGQTDGVV